MSSEAESIAGASGWRHLLLLLLVSAVVRSPTLFTHSFNVDESYYSVGAVELLEGARFYRDVVDHKPPGIYFIFAGIFSVAGRYNLRAVYLVLMVVVALTGFLLGRLATDRFDGKTGALAGLFYVIAGATGTPMDFQAANAELFMSLPLVAAFLVYGRSLRTGSLPGFFAVGLLVALASMIKLQGAFVLGAFAFHQLTCRSQRRLGPSLLALSGFLAPPVAVAVSYALAGAWPDLVWAMRYNLGYVQALSAGEQTTRALARAGLWLTCNAVVSALGVAYFLRKENRTDGAARDSWLLLLAWVGASLAAVSVGGRYFLHYFAQMTAPLALAAAVEASRIPVRSRLRGLVSLLLVLGVSASLTLAILDRRLRPNEAWHQDRYRAVADYVTNGSAAGARILVWGDSAEIYRLARRRPATRYLWSNYQLGKIWGTPSIEADAPIDPGHAAPETWRKLVDDFDRNRPELVVDAAAGGLDKMDQHPVGRYPALARRLALGYRLEATVAGVPIYRRVR